MTSVSSSRPRSLRSWISAAVGWSVSRHWPAICFGQIAVLVPAAMEELDEADAAFGQAARQKAVGGKRARLPRVGAVELEQRCRLFRKIRQLRHGRLHPIRHLVLANAAEDLRIAESLGSSSDSASPDRRETAGVLRGRSPAGSTDRAPDRAPCETSRPDSATAESRCPTAGRRAAGRSMRPSEIMTTNAGRSLFSLPRP